MAGAPFGPDDADEVTVDLPAEIIRASILNRTQREGDPGYLWLRNVRVYGDLVLTACKVIPRLNFENCEFDDAIDLRRSELSELRFFECDIRGAFSAELIAVKWTFSMQYCTAEKTVRMIGATVGGGLYLNDSALTGGEAPDSNGQALAGDRVDVNGILYLQDLEAVGEVRLTGSKIGGSLALSGAKIQCVDGAPSARALNCDSISLAAGFSSNHASFRGEVRMLTAKIGGQLSLLETTMEAAGSNSGDDAAFSCDGITVGADMIGLGLKVTGEVRLQGATISGQLDLSGAILARGEAAGGHLVSLAADRLKVGESAFMTKGFRAEGEVTMLGAQIAGKLSLAGAAIDTGEKERLGLGLSGASIRELHVANMYVNGSMDLREASIMSLRDTTAEEITMSVSGKVQMQDFTYKAFRQPLDAERRLAWISACESGGYRPGSYLELADVFARIGHSGEARKVALASEKAAIAQMRRWRPRWLWNKLLWITTGSGYRNWLAGVWLLGLISLGALAFWHCEGSFAATIARPPKFNPVLYAVDATVPVLDVGQQKAWAPQDALRWVSLFLTVAGYALVTAVIAAGAGLLNRSQG